MMTIIQGAKKIVNTCSNVQAGENVVVITDLLRPVSLGNSLYEEAIKAGGKSIKITYDGKLHDGQLPITAAKAIEAADLVICVTSKTLAYTKAVDQCKARGGRVIAITEATEDTFCIGAIEADYPSYKSVLDHVKNAFDRAEQVKVTAPGGTNLSLSIKGRVAYTCSGLCHEKGQLIGLPAMEVYIAPIEDKTNGTLVADASGTEIGLIHHPIHLTIENGRVIFIDGKEEGKKLEKMLLNTDNNNSYVIAEFAIGINPCSSLVGNIANDEGIYGTGHFALGNNLGFGGKNDAPEHYDLVYWYPTIELDGKVFMKDGVLCDI